MSELVPDDALRFAPAQFKLGSSTGIFTGVHVVLTANLDLPEGSKLDSDVVLKTPLSETPVPAASATTEGDHLVAKSNKADVDTNVPEDNAVPMTLMANFVHDGAQTQSTSTAKAQVVK